MLKNEAKANEAINGLNGMLKALGNRNVTPAEAMAPFIETAKVFAMLAIAEAINSINTEDKGIASALDDIASAITRGQ